MSDAAIQIVQLVKRYGDTVAVNGASLEVPRGSVFGLIGPNGAGKTTTFGVLAGFLRRDAGDVRILGVDPSQIHTLKGKLGVLPQDALMPASEPVGALLQHYGRLGGLTGADAEKQAREGLERVGLAASWDTPAGALSHGMARRVGLVQAMLLASPEVMLLDEPTSGLDPKSAAQVRAFIKQVHGDASAKRTVVISSHNLGELEELCDAAAILDRGRVVVAGTMAEITSQAEEVRFLLRDPPPLAAIQALPFAASASWDEARGLLAVRFSKEKFEAEAVIGQVLGLLLQQNVRISGVTKGRKLEERLLELT
ncbi:MAG: ABC transporter ATP-binding protein [Deltaproteobacteria bacterium]|nr:ABC transporter ATP-binding protein [Deltaproteobacteria bacterium]